VRFEDEAKPKARLLRLSSPALRVGDPVQISERVGLPVEGTIVEVVSAVVVVRR